MNYFHSLFLAAFLATAASSSAELAAIGAGGIDSRILASDREFLESQGTSPARPPEPQSAAPVASEERVLEQTPPPVREKRVARERKPAAREPAASRQLPNPVPVMRAEPVVRAEAVASQNGQRVARVTPNNAPRTVTRDRNGAMKPTGNDAAAGAVAPAPAPRRGLFDSDDDVREEQQEGRNDRGFFHRLFSR